MRRLCSWSLALVLAGLPFAAPCAVAQSLEAALANAYRANPDLNATRANVRAVDENVPSARSAYRPRITGSGDFGLSSTDSRTPGRRTTTDLAPAGLGTGVRNNVRHTERLPAAAMRVCSPLMRV